MKINISKMEKVETSSEVEINFPCYYKKFDSISDNLKAWKTLVAIMYCGREGYKSLYKIETITASYEEFELQKETELSYTVRYFSDDDSKNKILSLEISEFVKNNDNYDGYEICEEDEWLQFFNKIKKEVNHTKSILNNTLLKEIRTKYGSTEGKIFLFDGDQGRIVGYLNKQFDNDTAGGDYRD